MFKKQTEEPLARAYEDYTTEPAEQIEGEQYQASQPTSSINTSIKPRKGIIRRAIPWLLINSLLLFPYHIPRLIFKASVGTLKIGFNAVRGTLKLGINTVRGTLKMGFNIGRGILKGIGVLGSAILAPIFFTAKLFKTSEATKAKRATKKAAKELKASTRKAAKQELKEINAQTKLARKVARAAEREAKKFDAAKNCLERAEARQQKAITKLRKNRETAKEPTQQFEASEDQTLSDIAEQDKTLENAYDDITPQSDNEQHQVTKDFDNIEAPISETIDPSPKSDPKTQSVPPEISLKELSQKGMDTGKQKIFSYKQIASFLRRHSTKGLKFMLTQPPVFLKLIWELRNGDLNIKERERYLHRLAQMGGIPTDEFNNIVKLRAKRAGVTPLISIFRLSHACRNAINNQRKAKVVAHDFGLVVDMDSAGNPICLKKAVAAPETRSFNL